MESNIKNEDSQKLPHKLNLKMLPVEVQKSLLGRDSGEGKGLAIRTANLNSAYFLIATAVLWFLLLLFLADDYLWGNVKVIILAVISLISFYVLLTSLDKVYRRFSSGFGCYLLITPLYVMDINFNDVSYWKLDQLISVNSTNNPQSGNNQDRAQVTLNLENGVKTLAVKNSEIAEEIVEQIIYLRKRFVEASVRNDSEYLDSNDDLISLRNQNYHSQESGGNNHARSLLTGGISIVLAAGLMFGALLLNNYEDDKKSWEASQAVNHASSYRKYLQTHPQGRWIGDANGKLQNLYDEAEQKYRSSLNKDYDEKAVEAVIEILRYARQTQNYQVKVGFERHNEISPNIVEELKKDQAIKNMIPMGNTFTEEKMKERENNLLMLISGAFARVIPDDVLEIKDQCASECPSFLVRYEINSDSAYYDKRQEKVPENERVYYPGIYIDWNFEVKTPSQPQTYNFELTSDPAKEISYDSLSDEADNPKKNFEEVLIKDSENIYNSMAASAFDDFKGNLVYRMGIGEKPAPQIEMTDAPQENSTSKSKKGNSKTGK